jgi:hypothetical protein
MTTKPETRAAFADLSREQLAALLPELLLTGQLIDRSGMPHLISEFGREGMIEVAIEEWQVSSPIYTRRMQRALNYVGTDIVTIFKGLQLDIGAPPQFMDFRYKVDDANHGEFWLDHCGALMDVEPMGDAYVQGMCHDIEDPTFDATALATNPHAQVRPIHRPPRVPAGRAPHCAWTVIIDPSHEPPAIPPNTDVMEASRAAAVELSPIDSSDEGAADYSGPLLSDVRFDAFSKSALVRMAEEVCLQQHLLTMGFMISVRSRVDEDKALEIGRKQFAGIAGITSERLRKVLELGDDAEALATVLDLHPALNPRQYVDVSVRTGETVTLRLGRDCAAVADGSWPAMIDADHLDPLRTMVRGVNPRFDVTLVDSDDEHLTVRIDLADKPFKESGEVALTRFSKGADWVFADRGIPLPLTVVSSS